MKGVVISLGDCDLHLLPYWKCLLGHKWVESGPSGWWHRKCSRCGKYMTYELVNSGMNKAWVWRNEPSKP